MKHSVYFRENNDIIWRLKAQTPIVYVNRIKDDILYQLSLKISLFIALDHIAHNVQVLDRSFTVSNQELKEIEVIVSLT